MVGKMKDSKMSILIF